MAALLVTIVFVIGYAECGAPITAESCPVWMEFRDGECQCRDFSFTDAVFCDPVQLATYVSAGTCMTYDNTTAEIAIGVCPYVPAASGSYDLRFYTLLPENTSELNEVMCGPFNRQGLLCRSCRPGYGVAASSFGYPCAKCDAPRLGGLWYVLLELIPITVLYAVVLLFRIQATAAPMIGFVFFSHVTYNSVRAAIPLFISFYTANSFIFGLLQLDLFLSGIWNLSFVRFFIPPYCIGEGVTNVYAYFLEFIPALYPLLLVLITYIFIELHDRNVRLIVWIWKPFHKLFAQFRRKWNIKHSIVNVFSTFLLFSYTKMMFVSFRLLNRVSIYDQNGTASHHTLVLDPSLKSFGPTHLPFALVAVTTIILFAVLPIFLLLLYPTRLFQKLLRCCHSRFAQLVRVFVDTYQGCIKDGTNGTRDYRSLSSMYLILRFILTVAYIEFQIPGNGGVLLLLCGVFFMLISLLWAIFKPYKEDYMNYCELIMLFLLGTAGVFVYLWLTTSNPHIVIALVLALIGLLPHVALAFYIVYFVISLKKDLLKGWTKKKLDKYTTEGTRLSQIVRKFHTVKGPSEDEEIPDRCAHPEDYTTENSKEAVNEDIPDRCAHPEDYTTENDKEASDSVV